MDYVGRVLLFTDWMDYVDVGFRSLHMDGWITYDVHNNILSQVILLSHLISLIEVCVQKSAVIW